MNGYGSHTYLWINAAGEKHWVKYHFHSDQGVEGLTGERGRRRSPARTPTSTAATSTTPSTAATSRRWTLSVQVMPYEDAKTYRFNPFDLTKVWPHSDYPLIKVGTMTLNRNPENFFAQIEQAAFEPSALVPGIGFSPDKMLLGRAFAYSDTHRYRIGPNYLQLPVNRPARRGQHLHAGRPDGLRAPRRRPGLRAELLRPRLRRRGRRGRGRLGDRRRDGASGLHAARRRRRLRPGRRPGPRGLGRRAARRRSSRRSPGTCSAASSGDVLERAFEYWKHVDAETAASRSRSSSAPARPGRQPRRRSPTPPAADASDPIVETNTQAGN